MKSAFGTPMRLRLDRRLEKTQNLVSTNDPEVIESLGPSCNGIGMVMNRVAKPTVLGLFEIRAKGVARGRGLERQNGRSSILGLGLFRCSSLR